MSAHGAKLIYATEAQNTLNYSERPYNLLSICAHVGKRYHIVLINGWTGRPLPEAAAAMLRSREILTT